MHVDLSNHVRDIVAARREDASGSPRLSVSLADGLPVVDDDEGKLRAMIDCLVTTAVGASGDDETVSITTGTQAIDECCAAELFATEQLEPGLFVFLEVRRATTTTREDRGPGRPDRIDLAPLSRMMGSFRGGIRVEPSDGAAVRVLWPIASASPVADEPSAAHAASPPSGMPRTVLVVDDDNGICEMLADVLGQSGYQVMTANSGEDGLAWFTAHSGDVSVVLLDMTMPGMSGEETFRCMRKIKPDARIVVSTGHSPEAARRQFRAVGVAGFLQKPYRADALFACLERKHA